MVNSEILREHYRKVIYTQEKWDLFKSKRKRAEELLNKFSQMEVEPYAYGSIARGDLNRNSDIDIFFPKKLPIFKIEFLLNEAGYNNYRREIIMATPKDSIKLYIYLSELESITIPLTRLNKKSIEFYDFGGKVNLEQIRLNTRISGVDKRLVFINPTSKGHEEYSIFNQEHLIAKKLGISLETIRERKKVLLRREKHGRTGVFLKRELSRNETPQGVLNELAKKNSIVRRRLR
ncbi:MAG: Nucleotidyltransferase domain protein [Promethearchaeota archaeon]|nr:MAG: Nucleotidyltransferase domain protein [Candidatus Lokiarchaeota archaeon]